MAVISALVRTPVVISPVMIDTPWRGVVNVVDAWCIADPRAWIVDRRRLVVSGRRIIDGRRRVYGCRRCVVAAVVIGRRIRGNGCSGNRADRAAYDGAIAALNIVAD